MRRRILPLVLAAVLLPRAGVSAQSLQLRAGSWWLAGNESVRANGVSAAIPLGTRFVLEGHWQHGNTLPFGYVCGGLIPPGASCFQETIDLRADLASAVLAYRAPVELPTPWSAGVRVGAGGGWFGSERVGLTSGHRLTDDGRYALVVLGFDVGRRIVGSLPLRGVLDAEVGVAPRKQLRCLDCGPAGPFEGGFRAAALELALAWPLGARAPDAR